MGEAQRSSGSKRKYGDIDGPDRVLDHSKRSRRDKDELDHELEKQHRTATSLSHDQYSVGWVCALPPEMAAATGMLDNIHQPLRQPPNDSNTYILGTMAQHNVVIACLPANAYGNNNAATVATHMRRTFDSIRVWLLVGIGGAVPGKVDVRLGDVMVSSRVVQYDLGKSEHNGFHRTSTPHTPQQALMTAVSTLQANHELESGDRSTFLRQMLERYPMAAKEYADPGAHYDKLFDSSYEHQPQLTDDCEGCDNTRLLKRDERPSRDPKVHHGVFASGNAVVKDGVTRDDRMHDLGNICFEMEAAGLIGSLSCLAIRGAADYSDSHKSKRYQRYAATTAAAYAKELISILPLNEDPIEKVRVGNQATRRQAARDRQSRTESPDSGQARRGPEEIIRNIRVGKGGVQVCCSTENGSVNVKDAFGEDNTLQVFGAPLPGLQNIVEVWRRPKVARDEESDGEVSDEIEEHVLCTSSQSK